MAGASPLPVGDLAERAGQVLHVGTQAVELFAEVLNLELLQVTARSVFGPAPIHGLSSSMETHLARAASLTENPCARRSFREVAALKGACCGP